MKIHFTIKKRGWENIYVPVSVLQGKEKFDDMKTGWGTLLYEKINKYFVFTVFFSVYTFSYSEVRNFKEWDSR